MRTPRSPWVLLWPDRLRRAASPSSPRRRSDSRPRRRGLSAPTAPRRRHKAPRRSRLYPSTGSGTIAEMDARSGPGLNDPFEEAIDDALSSLPADLRAALSNVEIVVDDEPPDGQPLLGLYRGVLLPRRSSTIASDVVLMLRPYLAVADRSMNDFLRRKSLPGKVIHRPRPRRPHPARRGQYVTVTQWCARQAAPSEDNERHSAGIRVAGTHYPTRQLVRDTVRHFHVFVETSRRSGRARRTGRPTSCMTSRVDTLIFSPDYVTFSWCGHHGVRSISSDAPCCS